MQSGRIMPVIRQFFGSQVQGKRSLDSQSGQGGQGQGQPEREPTREEAQAAMDLLAGQEEFRRQSLAAELLAQDGRYAIAVKDHTGHILKVISGGAVLRLLAGAELGREGHILGRLLDRRV